MTTRHQIEFVTLSLIIIAGMLSSFFIWRNFQKPRHQSRLATPIIAAQTIIASTVNPILKIDTTSQVSPDGTKKLLMKTTHNTNGTVTYAFTTTDGEGNNTNQLYSTTLTKSETMSIPFNTWSPDNKYVFIQKNNNDVLLFKASGDPMTGDQQYFDIPNLFISQNKIDTYNEVTGWASSTLLVINTLTQNNTKGSSYWFEVPSKAIIQLSSQF